MNSTSQGNTRSAISVWKKWVTHVLICHHRWKRFAACLSCSLCKMTGFLLSSVMLSCHHIINLQRLGMLLLHCLAWAASLCRRLFRVMWVDVWVLPCNMIWIKIFIEQMRMGAKVLTCSTQRANISRWTWWVRSSMRFSTSFVTCQNKKTYKNQNKFSKQKLKV